jgi:signal transduction histidine kinase
MARLLEELLNLSRIGRKSAPFTRSTLGELSQEAIRLLAGRIDARGVKVEVRNGAESMYGDRNRLVELLQNLIDNAVKYSGDQAYPKVVVGVERPELRKKGTRPRDGAPDRERVFYVRDNGMGIDPRHSGKLFGLFEKLVPGTEGTGVGLAVVKRIVELHGGRVWAESEGPGKGSCFKFTLAESAARKGEDA